MNISQLGATMALNIPMIKTMINISSIVKPAADAVALFLITLFIDIWMHLNVWVEKKLGLLF
jgi:hypothetical protein